MQSHNPERVHQERQRVAECPCRLSVVMSLCSIIAGESFSDENSNPNIRSWSVGSGHPTHPWGSPLQPTPLGQKLTGML